LNGLAALRTLGTILKALHHPQQTGATPVLHMDVKPSNVMVLATGEVRLIDFTGARYWRAEEITQIAYTPESGGPEAFGGVSQLTPAYDVHGFGAVAYYLVTGEYPREPGRRAESPDAAIPTWSVLRRHAALERLPALRDHLHAPLADRPGDRPSTPEPSGHMVGRAAVVPKQPRVDPTGTITQDEPPQSWRDSPREDPAALKRGWELSGIGAIFVFVCWGIKTASEHGRLVSPLLGF